MNTQITLIYPKNCVVHWKSKITGYEGNSQEPMSYFKARSWIKHLGDKYPDIEHKIKFV